MRTIQLSGGNYTTRFLERNIWDYYLNLGEKKRFDMIAYHLRQEKSFSANFLIKCTYSKTVKTILEFIENEIST